MADVPTARHRQWCDESLIGAAVRARGPSDFVRRNTTNKEFVFSAESVCASALT